MKWQGVAAPPSEWDCKDHGAVCYAFVKSLAITKVRHTTPCHECLLARNGCRFLLAVVAPR